MTAGNLPRWLPESRTKEAKFPKGTPVWVKQEYAVIRESTLGGDFEDEEWVAWSDQNRCFLYMGRLNKIVESRESAQIWKALKSREGTLAGMQNLSDRFWWKDAKTLGYLTESVINAQLGFAATHTGGENRQKFTRRELATRGSELAGKLEASSKSLASDYAHTPIRWAKELQEIVRTAFSERMQRTLLSERADTLVATEEICLVLEQLATAISRELPDVIHEIAASVAALEPSQSMLGKPNDPRAERTFLIRHLAQSFKDAYKTPLNEVNLAVTSAFHDCRELTAAGIATLVRGSTKPAKKT